MEKVLDASECRLVELKARVESLDSAQKELAYLRASYVGTFHQIDTYFEVPEGRLKLREIEGRKEAELIYYEREDRAEPKRSKVFVLRIEKPEIFRGFFEEALKKKVVVDKNREIYQYRGTQIHLDTVKGLGKFIEFERETQGSIEAFHKDKQVLIGLLEKLYISSESLVKESYSDLLLRRQEDT